jgi:anthranilate synthase component 2
MKKIVIIDNFDSFTFNLVDYFKRTGNIVEVYRNNISVEEVVSLRADLIVFSPGPGSPEEAGNMIEIIKALVGKTAMFGVCLGHQAMILALNGTLKKVAPVHGKSSKIVSTNNSKLFKDIQTEFEAGRYHSLAAEHVPIEFSVTAVSEDNVVMAIEYEQMGLYGVQFHPESILSMKNNLGEKIINNLLQNI